MQAATGEVTLGGLSQPVIFRAPAGSSTTEPWIQGEAPPADRARRELLTGLAAGVGLTTLLAAGGWCSACSSL